jgi:hypothetical protein
LAHGPRCARSGLARRCSTRRLAVSSIGHLATRNTRDAQDVRSRLRGATIDNVFSFELAHDGICFVKPIVASLPYDAGSLIARCGFQQSDLRVC